jgi:hypothetical protein
MRLQQNQSTATGRQNRDLIFVPLPEMCSQAKMGVFEV